MRKSVCVIGAGLAGCEATWQLVKRGIPVTLYEMRPHKLTPSKRRFCRIGLQQFFALGFFAQCGRSIESRDAYV